MSDRLQSSLVDSGKGLSKWEVALLIGVPLAAVALAGTAVYLFLRRRGQQASGDPSREQVVSPPGSVSSESGASATTDKDVKVPKDARKPASASASASGAGGRQTLSGLDQALAVKQQGNNFFKQQKYEDALRCYEEAILQCPADQKGDMAVFYQNLAATYAAMASKTSDEDSKTRYTHSVVENCTKALERNPHYVKALTRRLKAYESLGRKRDAMMDITRVLLLDESQGRVLSTMVAQLLKSIGKELADENFPKLPPLAPTKHLVKTYFESFTWNDDLSEERLKELWHSRPKPNNQSGEAEESHDQKQSTDQSGGEEQSHELQQETDQSEVPVQESQSDQSDGFSDEPFVKAVAQFKENKYDDSLLELLTEAVEKGDAVFVPHALLLRGAMYGLWRQDEEALKDFRNVINTQGLSDLMYTNALVKRAGIFAGQGEPQKSRTCFEKAIAISPNHVDIFVHRARVKLEADDPEGLSSVIEDLEKAIKIAPNFHYALFSLASTYHRIGGLQQSMQLLESARIRFEEAIRKFPTFVDGMILYALFLQDLNQSQKAEEILNKAVKLEPDNPLTHFTLGLLNLVFQQDMERAITTMEAAITVDNSCVQAYDTLASLEMQRGNTARAMELYEKGIQFSRSEVEMSQAYIARELVTTQEMVCQEYGVSSQELATRAFPPEFH